MLSRVSLNTVPLVAMLITKLPEGALMLIVFPMKVWLLLLRLVTIIEMPSTLLLELSRDIVF